jgi:hypothetical protein
LKKKFFKDISLIERRLKLADVLFQLADSSDLLRDDRRGRRVAGDADRRVRHRDLQFVVGSRLLADGRLQRRDFFLTFSRFSFVFRPARIKSNIFPGNPF